MKRTLTFGLFLALAAGAVAQTPTVVEQPAKPAASSSTKPAKVVVVPSKTAQSSKTAAQKPSPATTKTGAAQKPAAANAKPAVIAVQPVNAKPVAVTPVKANPNATHVAVVPAKAGSTAAVKPVAVPANKMNAVSAAKPVVAAKSTTVSAPGAAHGVAVPAHAVVATKTPAAPVKGAAVAVKGAPVKAMPKPKDPFSAAKKNAAVKPVAPKAQAVVAKTTGTTVNVQDTKTVAEKKPEPRKVDAAGRRDPFISPVVAMGAVGSGCSSGKRCLTIDQIALRGVVKSDSGMIAVVVNAMDKAYFLRENDPVFNGYVVKITGDSIVFKETFHDKLGKPLTRDVTKTISRPVA